MNPNKTARIAGLLYVLMIPGVLLIIAGSGYLIDVFARILSPDYGTTIFATIIMVTLFGEIIFPIWLLIKGVNAEKWLKISLQTA